MNINDLEIRILEESKEEPIIFVFSNSILNDLEASDVWCIRHFKLWDQHPWVKLSAFNLDDQVSNYLSLGFNKNRLDFFDPNNKSENFNFLVTNSNNSNRISLVEQNEISILEASLLIRSLFKLSGYYYKQNHLKAGLTSFYNESIDTEVLRFRNLWKVTIELKIRDKNILLYEQILSLYQRISTFFRSADYVGSLSLLNSNNFINDELIYHFGYMILLAYGILEDFSWIVNHSENLSLPKYKIGIRNLKDYNELRKSLEKNHIEFYQLLLKSETQLMIELIFLLRSYLVHRNYLNKTSYSNISERKSKTLLKLNIMQEDNVFFGKNVNTGYFKNSLNLDDQGSLCIDPFSFTSQLFYRINILIEEYSFSMMKYINESYGV